ncbi:DUF4192 domain-containing protein [Cellulomonas sp. C5510]|uniref:DUF4192 domain-containing protein n=1 Tax=Cellulomonas sp. C5510 TaxID=2871170 RepID=UPI001C9660A3|nr:DUF4192 domain-containing protein [Cellulomonas sp. C5510]QZN87141.1 DUF4192 domain-containing protein [Cellulomonas sp. C5510]
MTTTTDRPTVLIPDAATGASPGPEHPDEPDGVSRPEGPAAHTGRTAPTASAVPPPGTGAPRPWSAHRSRASQRPHRTPDLLAALPYQLGFRPEECLVAVGLRGRGRDVGLVARIDLDDVLSPAGPDLLDDVAGHLAADDAAEVVVVVYRDEDDPRDLAPRTRPAADTVSQRAAEVAREALEPLGPVTTCIVAHGRYLALTCRDTTCCPPGGRPLAELEPGAGTGPAAARGRPLPRRADLAAVPVAPAGRRRSAAAARSRWADARLRASEPAALLGWRQRSLQTWRAVVADASRSPGGEVDLRPAQLGRIEAALDDTTLRDAVVIALIRPETTLPDALLRHLPDSGGLQAGDAVEAGVDESAAGSVSAAVRRTLDVLLEPERAERPRPEVASAVRAVLEAVVAHGRAGRQAPACTLLALLAWWAGDAIRARLLVDRALAEDPSHRLAELLDRALGVGLAPGWMRRRC